MLSVPNNIRRTRALAAAGFLSLALPLAAQFNHLVTNDRGDVLYFSSALQMRGSQQYDYPKLFVVDSKGIRLHTQRELTVMPGPTWPVSTYYSVEAAALNGDGSQL